MSTTSPQHMIGANFGDPKRSITWNDDFGTWSHGRSGSIETPPATQGSYTADEWYVGPGFGAKVNWSCINADVSCPWNIHDKPHVLRLAWERAATQGEDQYLPGFRYTFLERYCTVPAVPQMAGRTFLFSIWLKASGITHVKPISWLNYINGNYEIVTGEGWNVGTDWQCFRRLLTLPAWDALADPVDQSNYGGVGLDVVYPGMFDFYIGPMSFGLAATP